MAALKDIERGFYLDITANDPVRDSIGKAFFDKSRHGINLEPVAQWLEQLQAERFPARKFVLPDIVSFLRSDANL